MVLLTSDAVTRMSMTSILVPAGLPALGYTPLLCLLPGMGYFHRMQVQNQSSKSYVSQLHRLIIARGPPRLRHDENAHHPAFHPRNKIDSSTQSGQT